ncbi:hypothetical protein chiPu_0002155 [Chiloscyllium punctatum]|uniref:Uncharacterized protein n=1 Tax=Chiloscyllium punctatum TaxID=137246 RepID=A0A401S037_CHIPU|nr:hypothetical protein [Chiloscyllium punctatum]
MHTSLSSTSSEDVGCCGSSCANAENLESPTFLDDFDSVCAHGLAKCGRKHDSVLLRWPCDDRLVWSESAKVAAREVQVDSVEGVDGLPFYQEAESFLAATMRDENGLERAISDPDQNVSEIAAAALYQKFTAAVTRTTGTAPELLSHCAEC